MAKITIKKLKDCPEALTTVAQWVHDQWSEYNGRSYEATYERFAQEGSLDGLPVSLVALENTVPIGLISLREKETVDLDPNVSPWISNVYVPENARGKGVASKLCRAMESVAREMGYDMLYLGCEIEKDSLYHRLGYEEYGRTFHQGNSHQGQVTWLLRLRLAQGFEKGN